jgi:hypothetical protein
MTEKRLLSSVEGKLDAAVGQLDKMSPDSPGFDELLQRIERLMLMRDHLCRMTHEDTEAADAQEAACLPVPTPAAAEESPEATTETKPAPAPALTKEEVRSELQSLANAHHVDIAGVMAGMGYNRLSEVPAERYAELLDAARAKVA